MATSRSPSFASRSVERLKSSAAPISIQSEGSLMPPIISSIISPTLAPMQGADTNDSKLERATMRQVAWRLLPFLLLLYIISWLDRVNVGFAKLQMNADLGFSETIYGIGAGIFFV